MANRSCPSDVAAPIAITDQPFVGSPAYLLEDVEAERAGRRSPKRNSVNGMTAALLIIGDELLNGQQADLNSPFLCKELHDCGVYVRKVAIVPDCLPVIAAEVRRR